jgi:hypothetical protein
VLYLMRKARALLQSLSLHHGSLPCVAWLLLVHLASFGTFVRLAWLVVTSLVGLVRRHLARRSTGSYTPEESTAAAQACKTSFTFCQTSFLLHSLNNNRTPHVVSFVVPV